jgi:type VI secretion system protein ImpC
MARDKIGAFMSAPECGAWLNRWINEYVVPNPENVGEMTRAKKPLQEAKVEIREVKGRPGHYEAVAYLKPHYQLESLAVSMRLVAEVPQKN